MRLTANRSAPSHRCRPDRHSALELIVTQMLMDSPVLAIRNEPSSRRP